MDKKTYNVVIFDNQPSQTTSTKLAALFKITADKAEAILKRNEFIIKKEVDRKTAEKYHAVISKTGTNCRIDLIEKEEALPTIEEVETPQETRPLVDPTQQEIQAEKTPRQLNLEVSPVEPNAGSADANKSFKDVKPEYFCPECGTIRASETSVCIQCGYDPEATQSAQSKAKWIKIAAIIILLVAASLLALPFYQQYSHNKQVQDDLQLAFDIRNQVTEFIQKTNFWPNQNIDAGLPKKISNASIDSVVINEGAVISVTLKASATGSTKQTLVFTPNTLKGHIVWNCLKGDLKMDLRPEICKPQQK